MSDELFVDADTSNVDLTPRVLSNGRYDFVIRRAEPQHFSDGRKQVNLWLEVIGGETQTSRTPDGEEVSWEPEGLTVFHTVPAGPFSNSDQTERGSGMYNRKAAYYLANFKQALGLDQSEGFALADLVNQELTAIAGSRRDRDTGEYRNVVIKFVPAE